MGQGIGDLRWFALRVTPCKEQVTVNILERQGYIAAIPKEERMRRKHRLQKERAPIEYPSLRGFVFIAFGPGKPIEWYRLLQLHLVNSLVTVDGRPAQFNAKAMEAFLRFSPDSSPQYYKHMRTGSEFKEGDTVWILDGVLKDREMKVAEISGREAIFLLPLLGKVQKIAVDVDRCQKAA